MTQKSRKTNKRVGPKPSSRFSHHGAPVSSGCALIVTLCCWSSFESASVFANAGTSVLKFFVAVLVPVGGTTFFRNVP